MRAMCNYIINNFHYALNSEMKIYQKMKLTLLFMYVAKEKNEIKFSLQFMLI